MAEGLLTAKEVGEILGVHYATVHWYVKQGLLKNLVLRKGVRRTVRFEAAEIAKFIEKSREQKKKRRWLGILSG